LFLAETSVPSLLAKAARTGAKVFDKRAKSLMEKTVRFVAHVETCVGAEALAAGAQVLDLGSAKGAAPCLDQAVDKTVSVFGEKMEPVIERAARLVTYTGGRVGARMVYAAAEGLAAGAQELAAGAATEPPGQKTKAGVALFLAEVAGAGAQKLDEGVREIFRRDGG
jgi:hypothetical protein